MSARIPAEKIWELISSKNNRHVESHPILRFPFSSLYCGLHSFFHSLIQSVIHSFSKHSCSVVCHVPCPLLRNKYLQGYEKVPAFKAWFISKERQGCIHSETAPKGLIIKWEWLVSMQTALIEVSCETMETWQLWNSCMC